MTLFIDLETTGLPKQKKLYHGGKVFHKYYNLEKYNKARIVQLSYIIYDNNRNMLNEYDYIIKPNGFTSIPQKSIDIHKITYEKAMEEGVELSIVLDELYKNLDRVNMIVAHNIRFDKSVLLSEAFRMKNMKFVRKLTYKPTFCTMIKTRDICKLPSNNYDGYKNPKLNELHFHLFRHRVKPGILHNSLNDIRITAKCFYKLLRKGLI